MLPGTIGADGQAVGKGCVYPATVKTIADQLSAAGLSWKGYMEDMGNRAGQPHTCRHPTIGTPDSTQKARLGDQYAARHNPFVYFHSLLDSGACASRDVPLGRLSGDLTSAARTPNLSLISPNLCNDGHDSPCVDGRPGGLVGINGFLSTWVPRILASPAYRSGGLLAVLFDEAGGTDASACCGEPPFPNAMGTNGGPFPGPGGGRTGAVLLSPFIDPGTIDLSPANDFTTLRSLEDLFGLGHLGYAARPHLAIVRRGPVHVLHPAQPARPSRHAATGRGDQARGDRPRHREAADGRTQAVASGPDRRAGPRGPARPADPPGTAIGGRLPAGQDRPSGRPRPPHAHRSGLWRRRAAYPYLLAMSKNVRNVLIVLAIAALVALLPGGGTGATVALQAVSLAFLAALAWVAAVQYREHRVTLYSLGDRSRGVLYAAVAVATLTLTATSRMWASPAGEIAWLALLAGSVYAVVAVVLRARRY